MKTQLRTLATATLFSLPLSAVACSGGGDVTRPGREGTVTLTGVNTQNLSSMTLGLSDVTATVDGKAQTVYGISGLLELAKGGSQTVARFALPEGAHSVSVVVRFDDYGTYEAKAGAAGIVDARGKVLALALPVQALDQGTAAVSLDLSRSLSPSAGGWVLEPRLAAMF